MGPINIRIVNQNKQDATYTVTMQIDDVKVGIPFQGGVVDRIGPITLTPEEKWEQLIGIVPQDLGNDEKVEIFLYKDGGTEPYLNLSLSINVN